MKKTGFLFLIFLAACAEHSLPVTVISLPNGKKIKAETAVTPQETGRGLMYRESLAENKGMIFIFEEEAPRVFWMKNTFIDLDMVFIGGDKKIKCIGENIPRSTPFTQEEDAAVYGCESSMYVLELAAGVAAKNGLKTGDVLDFK
jgi:uncharacterized membrane protein (UPF0127 family)